MAKRVVLIVLGVVLLVIGALAAIGGGALMALFGSDDTSFAIGIGLLIGGIVLILIAIALIVLGVRTRAQ